MKSEICKYTYNGFHSKAPMLNGLVFSLSALQKSTLAT